jgi:DNA-binding transcriptional MerR regulator
MPQFEEAALDKAPEAFRTISEVAEELNVPKHVLRFWEAKFSQLKPMKRGGGRRYYRPEDVALLRGIRFLLYDDGYTIRGVQKILREYGPRYVIEQRYLSDETREMPKQRAPKIPDMASEAAQNRGRSKRAQTSKSGPDPETLADLLRELEACRRLLAEAKS